MRIAKRLTLAVAAVGLAVSACESSDTPATPAADVAVGSDAETPADDAAATSDTETPADDAAATSDTEGDDDDVEAPEADVEVGDDDVAGPSADTAGGDDDVAPAEDTATDTASTEDTPTQPGPSVTAGEAVYTTNCAGCHGADGRQIPSVDVKSRTDAQITEAVRQGKDYMPAFTTTMIGDAALADLIAYIRTL